MKKTIIISGVVFFMSFGQVFSRSMNDVVVSDGQTIFGDKVIPGNKNMKIYNADREITKIPSRSVESYTKEEKVFVRLPVLTKANDTVGLAFMQYITSRSGLQLFRYCSTYLNFDPLEGEIAPINPVYRYYIFKGGKYLMLLDETDTETFFSFFGVKVLA
jgi:hypothetical protein